MDKEAAALALGRILYEKMDHLDPSDTERPWETLKDREREFYRLCVIEIFNHDDLCRAVFADG
jgi:hypothetical protein